MHTFASERTCVRASVVCVCAESETLAPKQGKTTLLYKFKIGEAVATIPTIGFNTEEVQYKNIRFSMWDVGGQERIRALWKHYYQGAHACIFMVDASDHERFDEARDQLHSMLGDDLLRNVSVLVLANKQDLSAAASVSKVAEKMELTRLPHTCRWRIEGTNAVTGQGIYEGLHYYTRRALPSPLHSQRVALGRAFRRSWGRRSLRATSVPELSESRNEQRSGARARDLFSVVAAF